MEKLIKVMKNLNRINLFVFIRITIRIIPVLLGCLLLSHCATLNFSNSDRKEQLDIWNDPKQPFEKKWAAVCLLTKIGMSKTEIEALLGKPHESTSSGGFFYSSLTGKWHNRSVPQKRRWRPSSSPLRDGLREVDFKYLNSVDKKYGTDATYRLQWDLYYPFPMGEIILHFRRLRGSDVEFSLEGRSCTFFNTNKSFLNNASGKKTENIDKDETKVLMEKECRRMRTRLRDRFLSEIFLHEKVSPETLLNAQDPYVDTKYKEAYKEEENPVGNFVCPLGEIKYPNFAPLDLDIKCPHGHEYYENDSRVMNCRNLIKVLLKDFDSTKVNISRLEDVDNIGAPICLGINVSYEDGDEDYSILVGSDEKDIIVNSAEQMLDIKFRGAAQEVWKFILNEKAGSGSL